jgi:hypothetical protein
VFPLPKAKVNNRNGLVWQIIHFCNGLNWQILPIVELQGRFQLNGIMGRDAVLSGGNGFYECLFRNVTKCFPFVDSHN